MAACLGYRIFFRSLLVQASWNFPGQQNLGFFFMTWPALVHRQPSAAQSTGAGLRHLRNFNTHPYFAGLVAAAVVRNEEAGAGEEAVEGLKRSLMCALGAIGDEFFWGMLRPFAAVAALPAAIAGVVWAPLIMLTIYNIPHFGVRAAGITAGLGGEAGVVDLLERQPLSRMLPALGAATALIAGFIVGTSAFDRSWGVLPGQGLVSIGAALGVFLALLVVQSLGLGEGRLLALLSALTGLAGVFRVVNPP